MTSIEKAIRLIRNYPRVAMHNLNDLPQSDRPRFSGLKRKKRGLGHRGMSQFQAWKPLGQLQQKMPFYLSVPKEPYNTEINKRALARISLLELQRLIDLDRVDPHEPIDLTTICNTHLYTLDVEHQRHYGFELTDEGLDKFVTPVNIEVQFASEQVIAAIERVGGVITTRFYDLFSVWAKSDPQSFFERGIPIPKAKIPPPDSVPYYADAENRGYLADPEATSKARIWLAQKYGYPVVELSQQLDARQSLMRMHKSEKQIFHGLEPGWLVSLADGVVLKPQSAELDEYYKS